MGVGLGHGVAGHLSSAEVACTAYSGILQKLRAGNEASGVPAARAA